MCLFGRYAKSKTDKTAPPPTPLHAVADGVTFSFCQEDRGIRVQHGRAEETALRGGGGGLVGGGIT